jgi:hypothetical protein
MCALAPLAGRPWPYADGMRDREDIDSELRLLSAVRRAVREEGGPAPTTRPVDDLLDERNARRAVERRT